MTISFPAGANSVPFYCPGCVQKGSCTLGTSGPLQCVGTFFPSFVNSPVCTANDKTATASIKVVSSATSATFTGGTGAGNLDIVAYQCVPNPN